MSFGSRLRERREAIGLKQGDLGKLLKISGSAIGNYENDYSFPKADILYRVFDALKCDANFLFQDEMKLDMQPVSLSGNETELLGCYRSLNQDAQRTLLEIARAFSGNPDMQKEASQSVTA